MKIIVVSGGFDPIHSGHISYMKSAKNIGDHLVVALNSDEWLIKKKKKVFMNIEERKNILLNIECVDEVITFNDDDIGGAISPIRTPLLYRIIGFDTTGDSFFGIIKDDYLLHTPGLADGGNNTEFIFRHSASDGTIKTATWELNTYLSGLDWAGWDDWAHIVVSWDGNFNNSVILKLKGNKKGNKFFQTKNFLYFGSGISVTNKKKGFFKFEKCQPPFSIKILLIYFVSEKKVSSLQKPNFLFLTFLIH